MATSQNTLAIVATFSDNTQAGFRAVNQRLDALNRTTGLLSSALNRLKIAAQFYITFRIFSVIYRGVDALTHAIPNLIRRGNEWLQMLDKLQDATGMTAEQVSKLGFAASVVGVDTDKLGRDLSYLARNVILNEQHFKKFGISVRDGNNELKGSYEIFQAVRRALSQYGRQFMTAAASQRIFSEGGRELIDLLTLTDAQWKRLMATARQSGAIMSQAAISGAEAWRRAQNLMRTQMDVIGARILGGIAPVLTALTTGVTQSIQKNMANIINFVQRVVVVIAGFVGGLLGIDINLRAAAKGADILAGASRQAGGGMEDLGSGMNEAAGKTDRATSAIDKQIAALDRQLKRLDRIEDRRRARREHQELMADIADARRELSVLRSEHIFTSGMSLVEAELARQAHGGDIIAAEKKLADARKKLRQWEKQQELDAERDRLQRLRDALQDRLSAVTAANAQTAAALGSMFQGSGAAIAKSIKSQKGVITKSLKELLAETQKIGKDTNEGIMALLFGDFVPGKFQFPEGKTSGVMERSREGGLIKALQEFATALANFKQWVDRAFKGDGFFSPPQRDEKGKLNVGPTTGARALGWEDRGAQEELLSQSRAELDEIFRPGTWGHSLLSPASMILDPLQRSLQSAGGAAGSIGGGILDELFGGARPAGAASPQASLGRTGAGIGGAGMPVGLTGQQIMPTTRWTPDPQQDTHKLWRQYLGTGSPMYKGTEDGTSATVGVLTNTQPIADGNIGTDVTAWSAPHLWTRISGIANNAGSLTTDNSNFGNIGRITKIEGGVTMPVGNINWGSNFRKIGTINKWPSGGVAVRLTNVTKNWGYYDDRKQIGVLRQIRTAAVKGANAASYLQLAETKYGGIRVRMPGSRPYAAGTRYVPETGMAMLHQGEAVIPRQQVRRGAVGGAGSVTISLDAKATRDFLSGRPMTTSLRPLTGT